MSVQHRPWVRPAALAAPLLVLALAGCGAKAAANDGVASAVNAGNGKATTTTTMDDEQARLAFTRCMREHGVQIQDAGPGLVKGRAPGGAKTNGMKITGSDPQKMQAAMRACQKYQPNGGQPPKLNPQQIEEARKMSACMRDHGITDFPDPDKNGLLQLKFIKGKTKGNMDPENPTFKKAMEACRGDSVPMVQSNGDGPDTGSAGGGVVVQGGGQ
jgi:hypothetical protein